MQIRCATVGRSRTVNTRTDRAQMSLKRRTPKTLSRGLSVWLSASNQYFIAPDRNWAGSANEDRNLAQREM